MLFRDIIYVYYWVLYTTNKYSILCGKTYSLATFYYVVYICHLAFKVSCYIVEMQGEII